MNRELDQIMDEQIKQVLAEETCSATGWSVQVEYIAAAQCCLDAVLADLPKGRSEESYLVSGELLPFYRFRPGLGSL